jgi:hypothetical protein
LSRATWALAFCALPGWALAHSVGVSRGEYEMRGARLAATLTLARGELAMAVPAAVDAQGQLSASSLEAASAEIGRWLERGLAVEVEGAGCSTRFVRSRLVEADGVELSVGALCPRAGTVQIALPLLSQLSPGHRHLARWTGTAEGTAVLFREEESFTVRSGATGALSAVLGGVASGLRHTLAGPEHWVFLVVLALMATGWRRMPGLLGAFAAAHCAAMVACALGVGSPDPRWVHAATALMLGYLGLENWLAKRFDHRWALSALFGLIHGWAVSSAQALPAVLGFNVGLGCGLLAALLVVVPAVTLARRRPTFSARFAGPISFGAAALAAACVWTAGA